jgi:membrane-associated phospholipid phosphatase
LDQILSLSYRLEVLVFILMGWLVIYFFVNRMEVEPARRIDMSISIDRETPYLPLFGLVYFSTYPFVIIPFIILSDARQFYWMVASFVGISIFSSLIHALIPSKIERIEDHHTGGVTGWMLNMFQKTCKPYGNFPSMHVGLSVPVVVANYLVGGPIAGTISLLWAALIALSTLFTKQHYLLDVLAGIAEGILIFTITYWLIMV